MLEQHCFHGWTTVFTTLFTGYSTTLSTGCGTTSFMPVDNLLCVLGVYCSLYNGYTVATTILSQFQINKDTYLSILHLPLDHSGQYYLHRNFISPEMIPSPKDLVLVSHCTGDHLHDLVTLSEMWNGPISVGKGEDNAYYMQWHWQGGGGCGRGSHPEALPWWVKSCCVRRSKIVWH